MPARNWVAWALLLSGASIAGCRDGGTDAAGSDDDASQLAVEFTGLVSHPPIAGRAVGGASAANRARLTVTPAPEPSTAWDAVVPAESSELRMKVGVVTVIA